MQEEDQKDAGDGEGDHQNDEQRLQQGAQHQPDHHADSQDGQQSRESDAAGGFLGVGRLAAVEDVQAGYVLEAGEEGLLKLVGEIHRRQAAVLGEAGAYGGGAKAVPVVDAADRRHLHRLDHVAQAGQSAGLGAHRGLQQGVQVQARRGVELHAQFSGVVEVPVLARLNAVKGGRQGGAHRLGGQAEAG